MSSEWGELEALYLVVSAMPRNLYGEENYLAVEAALRDVLGEIVRMIRERRDAEEAGQQ